MNKNKKGGLNDIGYVCTVWTEENTRIADDAGHALARGDLKMD